MDFLQAPNTFFLVGLVIYFWTRHCFIKQTAGEKKVVSRIDTTEKILLGLVSIGVLLFPILYLFTPLFSFADYSLPSIARWSGAPILIASLWLFWRSHVDLGQNWSVSIEAREGHELVSHGVYRSIRHPMYASIWLWTIAQGLMLGNWLAGWAALPAFAAMYFIRLPREEALMKETFGDSYKEYSERTGRVLPRLSKRG